MDQTELLVTTVLVAVLGAAVGSFLNVVAMRTKEKRPFLTGRSACPHCGRGLEWFELVPVLSFVALGGRCRRCRNTLTVQYLLMECLTSFAFAAVYLRFGWTWESVAGWVAASGLLLVAAFDARWKLIPDHFTAMVAAGAFLWQLSVDANWLEVLIGAGAGAGFFGLQYVLSRRTWVGSGDILLAAALGLLLGWRMLAVALIMAYIAGAIAAVVLLTVRRPKPDRTVAFGPYLAAASFVAWLWGPQIVQWYLLHV